MTSSRSGLSQKLPAAGQAVIQAVYPALPQWVRTRQARLDQHLQHRRPVLNTKGKRRNSSYVRSVVLLPDRSDRQIRSISFFCTGSLQMYNGTMKRKKTNGTRAAQSNTDANPEEPTLSSRAIHGLIPGV